MLLKIPRVVLYKKAKKIAANNPNYKGLPEVFKTTCLSIPTKLLSNFSADDVLVKKFNTIAGNIEKLYFGMFEKTA